MKKIEETVAGDISLEDFFSQSANMAKLVYLGEEGSIY